MSVPHQFRPARERFAFNLRKWRSKRSLSQEALAEACGLSRVFVAKIESGSTTVSLDNIEKLAQVLEIDIVDLVLP